MKIACATRWVSVVCVLAFALRAESALAQACCAGGSVATPTRLAVYERVAVGFQTSARQVIGEWNAAGDVGRSTGTERSLDQTIAATFRLASRWQASASIPSVETFRSQEGVRAWGGGVGDATASVRYDALTLGEWLPWPAVGLILAATAPTGKPPERSEGTLGTDVTGAGTWEVAGAVHLEQTYHRAYFAVMGETAYRLSRTISASGMNVKQSYPLRGSATIWAGYALERGAAAAMYLRGFHQNEASAGSVSGSALNTAEARTTLGVAGMAPFWDGWRVQCAVFSDLPFSGWGRNVPATSGLSVSLVHAWL